MNQQFGQRITRSEVIYPESVDFFGWRSFSRCGRVAEIFLGQVLGVVWCGVVWVYYWEFAWVESCVWCGWAVEFTQGWSWFKRHQMWSYASHGAQCGVTTSHSTCCGYFVRDYHIRERKLSFGKVWIQLFPPVMGKIVGQTRLFSFGMQPV